MYLMRTALRRLVAGLILLAPVSTLGAEYLLVAASAPPGSNALNQGPVIRYEFNGTEALVPTTTIPESQLNDPAYVAFSADGELFVGNRHGNVGQGIGSISRFVFDSLGGFASNGSITGNNLEAVHGVAFNSEGELFAANLWNGVISRFVFDAGGTVIANGVIATGENNQSIAFSSNGEMFTTHGTNRVRRWHFDPGTGAVTDSGFFVVAGASRLHGLAFSAAGELFVGDIDTDAVYRFLFDGNGSPIANGVIQVSGGPLGVSFSSEGELFVSSHFTGGLSRFLFDSAGNAIPNGFTATGTLGGVAVIPFVDRDHDGVSFLDDCDDHACGVNPQADEVCNGQDDNCDGIIDDLGTLTCGAGVCVHSVDRCLNGVEQTCDPFEGASAEICDGLDNDCDGAVDEELTAPTVTASLTPAGAGDEGGDDDEGAFLVDFSVSDDCDANPTVTAVLDAPGCGPFTPVTVQAGQLIEFEREDEGCELEYEVGKIEIEAADLVLRVTATDASGNTTVAEAYPSGLGLDNDTEAELDD